MRGSVSETKKEEKPVQCHLIKGTSDTSLIATGASKEPSEMGANRRNIYYLLLSPIDQEWSYRH